MDDENTASTHPCKRGCGRVIPNRYAFHVCVRCSLNDLERDPDIINWRSARRTAAYTRLREAGLVTREGGIMPPRNRWR